MVPGFDATGTESAFVEGEAAVEVCDLLHAAGLTPADDESLGLTAHEEAVVAQVVRGLTNREAARELFVSPRTVAYHLSNVYAKLGVTTRSELRERVAR